MENEIRKSDRGILIEILVWLSERPCPSSESVETVKAYVSAHLEATKGESLSWQTHSRQLIAETEAQTTRLLATKFVADEAVGLVRELVGALSNVCKRMGWSDDHDLDHIDYIGAAKSALAKAAQFTAAGTGPSVGGASEPVIFPPDEVEAVPEYVPHWPWIPEPFDHVAVDKDGKVFCHVGSPELRPANGVWYPMSDRFKDFSYVTEIPPPPGETWQKMVYKRPE